MRATIASHTAVKMFRAQFAKINYLAGQKKLDKMENAPLEVADEEMYNLLREEKLRQISGLELVASENYAPRAVLEAVGSCIGNKYAEGYPGRRYYGGTEVVDKIERLTQKRALDAFNLDENVWGVNVQALSGTPANLAVYTALLRPGGRLMGLALSHGGHLSHGYQTRTKKISASSLFFESLPYTVDPDTGLIDYDALERNALLYRPKIIIAGASSYCRDLDYQRFRQIADTSKSLLMADMAHVSGLVAHGLVSNPFEYCHVVTTTTHKTMKGPRGALIFYRKDIKVPYDASIDVEKAINDAVFPCLQGGPHENNVAGIGVALKILKSPAFEHYAKQVVLNCRQLVDTLQSLGYTLVTGGSDNHMCMVDLRPMNLDGAKAEMILEKVMITVNKNTVPGDVSAVRPNGLRLGSPAMTGRGMGTKEFDKIARLIDQALKIACRLSNGQNTTNGVSSESVDEPPKFEELLDEPEIANELKAIRSKVVEMCSAFPMPGHELI